MLECKWLFGCSWEEMSNIQEPSEDFSLTYKNVEIYLSDLHQFNCDFITIADFFKLDLNKKSTETIIFLIFQHKALEFIEEYHMYKRRKSFIKYSKKIENAVFRLKHNSYYKQSAKKAFEKEPIGTDSYWLLKWMIKYKKDTGKNLALKEMHLKSLLLHYLFKDWFDLETAKKILKNSSL